MRLRAVRRASGKNKRSEQESEVIQYKVNITDKNLLVGRGSNPSVNKFEDNSITDLELSSDFKISDFY